MPWVRPYVRSDGTPVRGHSRWAPGARRETMLFGVVALVVVGLGNSNASAGGEGTPRPQSTVQYPIRFDNAPAARAPKPRPTVSYPIRWER
jgi:hypothetical protein